MANRPPYPGPPRWVKVFGIGVIVMVLLIVAIMVIGRGEHGPGRHAVSGEAGGQLSHPGVIQDRASLEGGGG